MANSPLNHHQDCWSREGKSVNMVMLMPKTYQMKAGNQRPDLYSLQVEKSSETEFGHKNEGIKSTTSAQSWYCQ